MIILHPRGLSCARGGAMFGLIRAGRSTVIAAVIFLTSMFGAAPAHADDDSRGLEPPPVPAAGAAGLAALSALLLTAYALRKRKH